MRDYTIRKYFGRIPIPPLTLDLPISVSAVAIIKTSKSLRALLTSSGKTVLKNSGRQIDFFLMKMAAQREPTIRT